MRGRLYIDNIDVYKEYGALISNGGYNELLSQPEFKTLEINDWQEEDGQEVNLINPVLNTHTFNLSFDSVDTEDSEDLLYLLSEGSYHEFNFAEIDQVKTLRLVSHNTTRMMNRLERFTIQLADDFPLKSEDKVLPPVYPVNQSGYDLDEIPFSDYGVYILEGSDEQIMRTPEVKPNLTLDYNTEPGAIYDNHLVTFQSKDVALKCLMRAPDIKTYNRNAQALLHALIQPGEHEFHTYRFTEKYPCYYKSWKVTKFQLLSDKSVWCEFTLTLVFTWFRPRKTVYVIGAEDKRYLRTEDKENFIKAQGWQKNTGR